MCLVMKKPEKQRHQQVLAECRYQCPYGAMLASLQVANFINYINTGTLKKFATINVFDMFLG